MTKHHLHILICCLCFVSVILSCSKDDDISSEYNSPVRRTIIAYITGDNNLSSSLGNDITEMITGSKNLPSDCRLIVYADIQKGSQSSDGYPYIAEIKNGEKRIVYKYEQEHFSTSIDNMTNTLQWIIDRYPAEEYALIMSGHGSGSIIREDSIVSSTYIRLYAYGYDSKSESITYGDGKGIWINIPSLATVFSNLKTSDNNKLHFEYIFFDCCCMQTAETAYELRNYADYIIASASEVPGDGAPYVSVVPVLGDATSNVGASIINKYINDSNWKGVSGIAISAVKTSELNNLMNITRDFLQELYHGEQLKLNHSYCPYYYRGDETDDTPVFYDFKAIMKKNLSAERYQQWLEQFDKTIVAKYIPISISNIKNPWRSQIGINFYDFTVTEDNCGCIGFFFPYAPYDNTENRYPSLKSINKTMFNLEWVNAIGWHNLGW